jgi:hypothetical protein
MVDKTQKSITPLRRALFSSSDPVPASGKRDPGAPTCIPVAEGRTRWVQC